MLDKKTLIKVTNRSNGRVSYGIPDSNGLRRLFHSKETKEIPMEELRKVMWSTGGAYILKNTLIIENKEAVQELFSTEPEPEYYYTEDEIKQLLLTGTNDQLLDCLDFAPEGVVNVLKNLAVTMKLNDMSKREIIFEKTGFNVTNAININKESEKEEEPVKTERRATPIKTSEEEKNKTGQRRVPNYKVTSISK